MQQVHRNFTKFPFTFENIGQLLMIAKVAGSTVLLSPIVKSFVMTSIFTEFSSMQPSDFALIAPPYS